MAHYILYLVSLWLVVSPLYLGARRIARARAGADVPPMPSLIAVAINLLACANFSIAIILADSIFFQGGRLRAVNALSLAILVSVIVDSYSVLAARRIRKDIPKEKLTAPLIILTISTMLFAVVLYIRSMPGSSRAALKMSAPFQGSWRVITGGRFKFMNYHHGNPPSQNSEVDFVVVGAEGLSLGRPLFAPVDGLVIRATHPRRRRRETSSLLERIQAWMSGWRISKKARLKSKRASVFMPVRRLRHVAAAAARTFPTCISTPKRTGILFPC